MTRLVNIPPKPSPRCVSAKKGRMACARPWRNASLVGSHDHGYGLSLGAVPPDQPAGFFRDWLQAMGVHRHGLPRFLFPWERPIASHWLGVLSLSLPEWTCPLVSPIFPTRVINSAPAVHPDGWRYIFSDDPRKFPNDSVQFSGNSRQGKKTQEIAVRISSLKR